MPLARPIRSLLVVVVIATGAALVPVAAPTEPRSTGGDLVAFSTIVDRLKGGEPYYRVQGEELRARNYPTAQVFNWRTPVLLVSLARAPRFTRGLFIALGVAVCFLTISLLRPGVVAAGAGILQLGNLTVIVIPNAIFMGEVWAGALIALSLCAYLRNARVLGAVLGGLALFLRELAAPYCLVCGIFAMIQRRRSEVAVWVAAAALYSLYFLQHVMAVWDHQTAADRAHSESWLQFGGIGFLLSMMPRQSWFLAAPTPILIGALALIVLGTLRSQTPAHLRLASATFVVFFLIVGHGFNNYWAYLAWPTWAMVSGYGLQEVVDVANDVRGAWFRRGETAAG
jgi:hypothetical protein